MVGNLTEKELEATMTKQRAMGEAYIGGALGRALACGLFTAVLGVSACGGAPSVPEKTPSATASVAPSSGPVVAAASEPVYPKTVDDLTAAIPRDATLVAGVPGFGLVAKLPGMPTATVVPLVADEIASKTGVPSEVARAVVEGYDGAELFLLPKRGTDAPPFAAVLRFRDGKPIETVLAKAKLERLDAVRYRGERPNGDPVVVAWLPEPRVAIVSADVATVDAALDALSGRSPSFQTAPLHADAPSDRLSLVADLAALVSDAPGLFDRGSKLRVALGLAGSELDYVELGDKVPRLGAVLAPSAHDPMAKLPGHAIFATSTSLKRRAKKTVRDLLVELGRPDGSDPSTEADAGLEELTGVGLDDLDRALGDEIAVGGYLPDKGKGSLEQRIKHDAALFITIASRDDATAKKVVDGLAARLKKKKMRDKTTASPGKLTIDGPDGFIRVEAQKGVVAIAFGGKDTTGELMKTFASGKGTLGEDAAFAEYKKRAAKESHVAQYADVARMILVLGPELGDAAAQLRGLTSATLAVDFTASASDKGLEVSVRGDGVTAVLGVVSAVAVYGVRSYLTATKGVEARVTVHAIARDAIAAFEREGVSEKSVVAHRLCDSATPVPAKVSAGTKYAPSNEKGKDFDTGSATAGWKCLKFAMTEPMYFQYDYRAGHGYKGPARGGPNPGPKGFEVSAEGDLDGDGKTSLYTLTGKVGADGQVHLDNEMFVADEGE